MIILRFIFEYIFCFSISYYIILNIGELYVGQSYVGQPYVGQPYIGQSYLNQSYLEQSCVEQAYVGQPYIGQLYIGQSYIGQSYLDQSYVEQPYLDQPYTELGYTIDSQNLIDIYRSSYFGVELESCYNLNTNYNTELLSNITNTSIIVLDRRNSYRKFFNNIMDNYFEKLHINHKFFKWLVTYDGSVKCNDSLALEIISPILSFANDSYDDDLLDIIKSKLFNNDNLGYSNGLLNLLTVYNLILNNNIEKRYYNNYTINTFSEINDSQGLHIHISNKHLNYFIIKPNDNYMYDKTFNIHSGLGIIKMAYFVRTFAFFEFTIRNFLRRNEDLAIQYWSKAIYYNRTDEKKTYIEDTLRDLLYNNLINIPKSFDDYNVHNDINNMYIYLKNHILPKHGPESGAFSIQIYNNLNHCNDNNFVNNMMCKGHFEIRLHHSTNNYAEIHNWILFLNLFLSRSIITVDQLYKHIINNDIKKFNIMFDKYVYQKFPIDYNNTDVLTFQFNELFDVYIQNDVLKKFYHKRCRNNNIQLYKNKYSDHIVLDSVYIDLDSDHIDLDSDYVDLHSKYLFDSEGEIKSNSIIYDIMKIFPLDNNVKTFFNKSYTKKTLIDMIQNI
jgi:hypothetical protein